MESLEGGEFGKNKTALIPWSAAKNVFVRSVALYTLIVAQAYVVYWHFIYLSQLMHTHLPRKFIRFLSHTLRLMLNLEYYTLEVGLRT